MRLTDLKSGETGIITAVNCEIALKSRLNVLGVFAGVKIKVIRFAPFNGPVEVMVRGYCLAIRKNKASQIMVKIYDK